MKPEAANRLGVKALCPDCGLLSYFDWRDVDQRELGYLLIDGRHDFRGQRFSRVQWRLLRCSNCQRCAVAKFHDNGGQPYELESFAPRGRSTAKLPAGIPEGIVREFREAELCASTNAFRAASAMVRSALEKTLKLNGFTSGTLASRIDQAAADGVITEARKQKAHADVRVLGNEVVHDDWRSVDEAEVDSALHYAQRILEDLYDDRPTVEATLKAKGRAFVAPSQP